MRACGWAGRQTGHPFSGPRSPAVCCWLAKATASTACLALALCGNGEWGLRPDAQSACLGNSCSLQEKQNRNRQPSASLQPACWTGCGSSAYSAPAPATAFNLCISARYPRCAVLRASAGSIRGCHRTGVPATALTQQRGSTKSRLPASVSRRAHAAPRASTIRRRT